MSWKLEVVPPGKMPLPVGPQPTPSETGRETVIVQPAVPALPSIVFQVPIDPVGLANYLLGVVGPGRVVFTAQRLTFLVLSGYRTVISFNTGANAVSSAFAPFVLSSDYYSSKVVAYCYTGNQEKFVLPKDGAAFTHPIPIPPQALFGVRDRVVVEVDNTAGLNDVECTVDANMFSVDVTLWDSVMLPVMRMSYKRLQGLAQEAQVT